jgi:hypothetical protein
MKRDGTVCADVEEAGGIFQERPPEAGIKLGAPLVKASGGISNFDRLAFGSALILS